MLRCPEGTYFRPVGRPTGSNVRQRLRTGAGVKNFEVADERVKVLCEAPQRRRGESPERIRDYPACGRRCRGNHRRSVLGKEHLDHALVGIGPCAANQSTRFKLVEQIARRRWPNRHGPCELGHFQPRSLTQLNQCPQLRAADATPCLDRSEMLLCGAEDHPELPQDFQFLAPACGSPGDRRFLLRGGAVGIPHSDVSLGHCS